MTVMTQRRLEQLRRSSWNETRGFTSLPYTQDYIIALKMRVMELEEITRIALPTGKEGEK